MRGPGKDYIAKLNEIDDAFSEASQRSHKRKPNE
jgi:hypothetical protein